MIPSLSSIASRLRLKQLRLLIAFDDHGSIHRAAEVMAITQPGATKALNEIESILGVNLFERNHKGLVPNALGRCVVRYARLVLTDIAHLREEMIGIVSGHGGRLSVGAVMGAVPCLAQCLTELRTLRPDLTIEMIEDTSVRLLNLLDQGRLDLAVCRTSVGKESDIYDIQPLGEESLVVVANPDHRLLTAQHLTLSALSESQWVVFAVNLPLRQTLEREFRDAGLNFPQYPIECSSALATLSLLRADPNLLAAMPADVARQFIEGGLLKPLPYTLGSKSEPYEIVTRRDAELSVPVSELLGRLVMALA